MPAALSPWAEYSPTPSRHPCPTGGGTAQTAMELMPANVVPNRCAAQGSGVAATNSGSKGRPVEAPRTANVLGAVNDQHRELPLAEERATPPGEVAAAWVHAMPAPPMLEGEAPSCPEA